MLQPELSGKCSLPLSKWPENQTQRFRDENLKTKSVFNLFMGIPQLWIPILYCCRKETTWSLHLVTAKNWFEMLHVITVTAFDHHEFKCRSEGNQLGGQAVWYKKRDDVECHTLLMV